MTSHILHIFVVSANFFVIFARFEQIFVLKSVMQTVINFQFFTIICHAKKFSCSRMCSYLIWMKLNGNVQVFPGFDCQVQVPALKLLVEKCGERLQQLNVGGNTLSGFNSVLTALRVGKQSFTSRVQN